MLPVKQVLFKLTQQIREVMGGEQHSDCDNPADVFFGSKEESSSSSQDGNDLDNQEAEEFFNMTLDEQDFY